MLGARKGNYSSKGGDILKTFIVHVSVDAESGDTAKMIVRTCIESGAVNGCLNAEQNEVAVVLDSVDEVED